MSGVSLQLFPNISMKFDTHLYELFVILEIYHQNHTINYLKSNKKCKKASHLKPGINNIYSKL